MENHEALPRSECIRVAMDRLVRTMRIHHRVIERRMDGLGIHHSQHRMLMRISNMGRTTSQKDIATALEVTPACVARALKSLNSAGLIAKAEGADSRRREVSLLPEGQRLVDDSLKTFQQIDEAAFSGITDDEIRQIISLFSRIHRNLLHMEKGDAESKGSEAAE